MIYSTARYRVKNGELDACVAAIREFVSHVSEEPGTKMYVSLQDRDDETAFVHLMIFDDEAAREAHANSVHVKAFTHVLYARTVAPPVFNAYAVVADAGS